MAKEIISQINKGLLPIKYFINSLIGPRKIIRTSGRPQVSTSKDSSKQRFVKISSQGWGVLVRTVKVKEERKCSDLPYKNRAGLPVPNSFENQTQAEAHKYMLA